MLQRVDAMESELAGLVESLRTGANRLTADMSLLEGGMGDLYDAAGRGEIPAPTAAEPAAPRAAASVPPPTAAETAAEVDGEGSDEPEVAEELFVEETVVVEAVEAEGAAAETDTEGARLVALNMALNGTSREETDRYLSENFDLADRGGLLDEVYATVEP
jgi:hypothetical protein